MALSKDEQRSLDELEAALAAEDPQLANKLRGASPRRVHKRRAAVAGVLFVVGLACLVGGLKIHFLVSALGFVMMLAATVVALASWRRVEASQVDASGPAGAKSPTGTPFMDKLEDRWRRRQQEQD
ncbi:MAG: DUF3040 domain-containing protein [Propionibacteriaceae bacterium]|jgi:hypothetical protein|nr:DUF3040 domain-containing protein [Propionibacteriaceae bacterium]